jgi:hypothetical protein
MKFRAFPVLSVKRARKVYIYIHIHIYSSKLLYLNIYAFTTKQARFAFVILLSSLHLRRARSKEDKHVDTLLSSSVLQ